MNNDGHSHPATSHDLSTPSNAPPLDRVVETDNDTNDGPYAPNTQGLPGIAEVATGIHSQPVQPQAGASVTKLGGPDNKSAETIASRLRRSLTSPALGSPAARPGELNRRGSWFSSRTPKRLRSFRMREAGKCPTYPSADETHFDPFFF
jgi:hypothetical protein